ncbi:MAG: hypothetical protein H7282_06295 [Cytophagaceae bacterium]|nr:hypothetical protein [Cytophagaceae bacterium]
MFRSSMKDKSSDQKTVVSKNIYEQRFDKMMMMIRIDKMLKSAIITHKK